MSVIELVTIPNAKKIIPTKMIMNSKTWNAEIYLMSYSKFPTQKKAPAKLNALATVTVVSATNSSVH
uniref:MSP domain-containing protein n=1 Tax=Ascaris lumbricoides TaxID=6252 RepID=A0A0M3HJJ0_ASCLU